MVEQRIRWYLCPLMPHPSGDPEVSKTPHSFSWQGYGRRTNFPFPGDSWCLLRARTTLANHDKLTVVGSPMIALPRFGTRLADGSDQLKLFFSPLRDSLGLLDTDDGEVLVDKLGRFLEPGFDRQRIRTDTIQDGIAVRESEMVEE